MSKLLFERRSMPANLERRNEAVNEMERMVDGAKAEKRGLSTSEMTKFNTLKGEVENIDLALAENSIPNGLTKVEKRMSNKELEEIRKFVQFVRTGESRDLASGNNGSVIPVTIGKNIVDKVFEISPLVKEAMTYMIGEDLNLPVYDYSQHTSSFLTEFVDIVESAGTFTSIPLKSKIIGTMAKLGKSLVNRTDLEVLPFIVNACAKSVARFLENEIVLNTNAKFASTLANGVTQTLTTGTTGVISVGELVRLKNSIPSIMLNGAKWLMHKDTLSFIQSLLTSTGEPIFSADTLAGNQGNMLLGYEVMLSDAMPRIGVNARQMYFGNFREGLAIKIGSQTAEIYRELYAKQYALGIGFFMEADVSASHSVQSITAMIGV